MCVSNSISPMLHTAHIDFIYPWHLVVFALLSTNHLHRCILFAFDSGETEAWRYWASFWGKLQPEQTIEIIFKIECIRENHNRFFFSSCCSNTLNTKLYYWLKLSACCRFLILNSIFMQFLLELNQYGIWVNRTLYSGNSFTLFSIETTFSSCSLDMCLFLSIQSSVIFSDFRKTSTRSNRQTCLNFQNIISPWSFASFSTVLQKIQHKPIVDLCEN